MAERRPPGFNVPLGFYDGPEVESIPRRIRAAAIGVWTLCGTFSANKLLDGYVGPEMLKQLGCTPAIRSALKATLGPDGEPDPLWIEARGGGIQFTKWVKYQRSRAEVKAYRDAEAERKRNARNGGKGATTSGDSEMSGRTSNGHPPDHRDPKTETETKTESFSNQDSSMCVPDSTARPSSTHTAIPSEFCPRHPNGTTERCGDCANARRAATAATAANGLAGDLQTIQRSAAATARRTAIADCDDCDDAGWLKDPDGTVPPDAPRCTHLNARKGLPV